MPVDQEHLLECAAAFGGLALLVQAQDRVQHGQADDHDAGRPLLGATMLTIAAPSRTSLHQVAVLPRERSPARLLLRLGELVRPVLRPASLDLGGVEPGPRVDASCALTSSAVRPCQFLSRAIWLAPSAVAALIVVRPHEDDLRAVRADLVAAVVLRS